GSLMNGSEFIDGEDLLKGSGYDGQGIIHGARRPEPDEAVGSDEHRAVTGDLAFAQPGQAGIDQLGIVSSDGDCLECDPGAFGNLVGRLHPCIAVLAGDEEKLAAMGEVLQGECLAAAGNKGVRELMAWLGAG